MTGSPPPRPSPLACRLDALTPAERRRRTEVMALLRTRLVGRAETEDGIAFQLRGDADVPPLAGEFISLESRCCPFIHFALQLEPDGGPVRLQLGGRPGVKEFLREAFLGDGATDSWQGSEARRNK